MRSVATGKNDRCLQAASHGFNCVLVTHASAARYRGLLPGILLSTAVAIAALAVQRLPGMGFLSPLIIAAVIGIACRCFFEVPSQAKAGVVFSAKVLLRFAIILLGLQLSIGHIVQLGWAGIVIAGIAVSATFLFTVWFGRLVGANRKLVELLAAGTSVCGASAIVAANTVTQADEEDVAYALGCVTFFGTLAVIVYPIAMAAIGLSEREYGLWTGSSIHEVAQVVAAGFQGGPDAGGAATVVKLIRVLMLAPLMVVLVWLKSRSKADDRATEGASVPGFVIGFAALVAFNSIVSVPPIVTQMSGQIVMFMLTVALGAIGLLTSFGGILSRGFKPLAVGAASTVFIAVLCLLLSVAVERLM